MGNARLGRLPQSRDWREVLGLIEYGADAAQIATATLHAARKSLAEVSKDPGVLCAASLVAGLPLAAREDSFAVAASNLGLVCPDDPDRHTLAAAVSAAVDDRLANQVGRTDLGEMAQMAAVEVLQATLADRGSLFDPKGEAGCRHHLAELAAPKAFGEFLARFFARLLFKVLDYFLSRELPLHIGEGRRFSCLDDIALFYEALHTHCREASGGLIAFAPGYLGKHGLDHKKLTPDALRDFVHGAAAKLADELQRRAGHADL